MMDDRAFSAHEWLPIGMRSDNYGAGSAEPDHTGSGRRTNDPQARKNAAIRITGNTTALTVVQP